MTNNYKRLVDAESTET